MAALMIVPQARAEAGGNGSLSRADLERLVDENIGWLSGWLGARTGDRELVHDIVQETFLRAFRSLGKLRDPGRLPGWLYRTAENLLFDHMRRRRRQRTRLVPVEELDRKSAAPDGAAVQGEAAEEVEKAMAAVRALPPRYREPFLLRHAQELSYTKIAEILGISQSAVHVRMFRARQMLRARCDGPGQSHGD